MIALGIGIRHTVADKNVLLRPPAFGIPERSENGRKRRWILGIRLHLDRCIPHGIGHAKGADRPFLVAKHVACPKLDTVWTHAKQDIPVGSMRSGKHERPGAERGIKLYGKTVFVPNRL